MSLGDHALAGTFAVKRGILLLVVGIPAAAVLMGVVTLWVAFSYQDKEVQLDSRPLSKTSYRDER